MRGKGFGSSQQFWTRRFSRLLTLALAISGIAFTATTQARAQHFAVLHTFTGTYDGGYPETPLIFDSAGDLYGATQNGGAEGSCPKVGCGLVYELSPDGQAWRQTVLYRFLNTSTGGIPIGNLIFDSSGNLYGATSGGGGFQNCGVLNLRGCGLVYELSPGGSGWTESVLENFLQEADGQALSAGLVADSAGNFYGTTFWGGTTNERCGTGCGVVYRLSPNGSGGWQETVLYSFTGGMDGALPADTLVLDASGNLYGTTAEGGDTSTCNRQGCGVVFEVSPTSSGEWQETVLHTFNGKDGWYSLAGVIFDSTGNLYGTTTQGGNLDDCGGTGCGLVFELSPAAGGAWQETVLHVFTGPDGEVPFAPLVFDTAGNLYGTTQSGGNLSDCASYGCGLVFKLSPTAGGHWQQTALHVFTGGADGASPYTAVTFDSSGNIYGTAYSGGNDNDCANNGLLVPGCGVIFRIIP